MSEAGIGRINSDCTRKKIGAANLGKVHTKDHIEKCRQHLIGRVCSPETRSKIGNANRGRKRTLESINKQKKSSSGENSSSAKLTMIQVNEIREYIKENLVNYKNKASLYIYLSKIYNISTNAISQIYHGKTYKQV